MSTNAPRHQQQDLDYPQREPTEDAVFADGTTRAGPGESSVPSHHNAKANNAGMEKNNSTVLTGVDTATTNNINNNSNRGAGAMHVTFGNLSDAGVDADKRRSYSNLLQRNASSNSFTNNGSVFANGAIVRSVSGIQGGGAGAEKKAPASSPLQLLYQSFANPVSDEQAIENAVRETLGHEPMWRWTPSATTTAPPAVVVRDGADEEQAIAALSTGDELRGCVDPAEHYIFRNSIRAPRGERPKPYFYSEDSENLALAAAAQAAVRHRHRGLRSSEAKEEMSPCEEAEVPPVNETVVPLLGRSPEARSSAASAAGGAAAEKEEVQEAETTREPAWATEQASSPSSQTHAHSSHEPAAAEDHNAVPLRLDNNHRNSSIDRAHAAAAVHRPVLSATAEAPMDPASKINRTYLCTGSFYAEPISEADIGKEELIIDTFNALPSEQRRLELLEAFYVAHMQPYEQNASYTADDWDDMTETKVRRWFGVEFDTRRGCFFVTVFRRRVRIFLFSFLFRALCLFLFWVIMFCLVPKNWFYPGGLYFDTLDTIVFAGIAGTLVARILTLPAIVGVIWAGILWNNVPYTTRLTKGITLEMRQFVSMFGLSIGLIRAGLSLNVIRFKQKFKHYIVFSLLPMSTEMLVHGVCCKYIYGYPNFRWAFAEGFLLSSIAPSVVVPVIISFQRRGYGVRDGPSMMMLCSIAVDTAMCVWGIEFLLALEFHKMNTALLIVLAPIQVVVGLVGGVILGALVFVVTFYILFMEGERLPSVRSDRMLTLRHSVHVRYISIFFMVLVSFCGIAIGKRFSVLGGAAIGVVTIAGTFNYLCVRGGTADHLRVKADMAQTLTTVWDYTAMPSLFGLSGAAVNVHELFARSFIGQAFGLVFIGIGTRSLFAMLAPMITRLGLSWSEIVFCGVGWIGKGSVQGSLGSLAQTYATAELAAATTPEAVALAEERVEFGRKMKNTAVLGILVACPLCSIFLTRFTDRLLKPNT